MPVQIRAGGFGSGIARIALVAAESRGKDTNRQIVWLLVTSWDGPVSLGAISRSGCSGGTKLHSASFRPPARRGV